MAILLDGGANPSAVTYDGTALDKVVCNGVTVWERFVIPDFPESIPLVTIATSDGKTTYVRDAALSEKVLPGDDGKWSANYACDCTFETVFPQGKIAYLNRNGTAGTYELSLGEDLNVATTVTGVSGVPAGYAFERLGPMGTTATFYTAGNDGEYAGGNPNLSGLPRGLRSCEFYVSGYRPSGFVAPSASDYAGFYFAGGLVYQGGSTLRIRQA